MARAGDDPDASDPYFFVIDFGCGPTNFRSRRGGLSSNSEAASPLQHETQKQTLDVLCMTLKSRARGIFAVS